MKTTFHILKLSKKLLQDFQHASYMSYYSKSELVNQYIEGYRYGQRLFDDTRVTDTTLGITLSEENVKKLQAIASKNKIESISKCIRGLIVDNIYLQGEEEI